MGRVQPHQSPVDIRIGQSSDHACVDLVSDTELADVDKCVEHVGVLMFSVLLVKVASSIHH